MQIQTGAPVTSRLLIGAAALSLAAAAIHAAFIGEHWEEWWGYGLFFLLSACAQAVYALLLLALPRFAGRSNRGVAASILDAGIAGNAAIVLLYVITRTVGIPFFGPGAGSVEPATLASLLSIALELALIACLAALRWQRAAVRVTSPHPDILTK